MSLIGKTNEYNKQKLMRIIKKTNYYNRKN
jgi:hypothetical protein